MLRVIWCRAKAVESNAGKTPQAIRSDSSLRLANGLFNFSRLSAWWLRLGISTERIPPRHPQQNGRHERMHRTLKKEAIRPAGANLLQKQAKLCFERTWMK